LSTLQIERIDTFSGHRGPVYALEKGVDSLFYSAGSDGWVVQWNLAKPDVGKVIAQVEGSISALALDSAGILCLIFWWHFPFLKMRFSWLKVLISSMNFL
jgi:hypothetical protein